MPALIAEHSGAAEAYQEARDERLAICLANGVDPGDAFAIAHLCGERAAARYQEWVEINSEGKAVTVGYERI